MERYKQLHCRFFEKLPAIILAFFYAVLMYVLKIDCPVRRMIGFDCLGCGMTRAWICAFQLDFAGAFGFHGMFWCLPVLLLLFIFDGQLFKNKAANVLLITGISIGFLLNWIV